MQLLCKWIFKSSFLTGIQSSTKNPVSVFQRLLSLPVRLSKILSDGSGKLTNAGTETWSASVTFLLTVTKAILYQLVFQIIQHFRFRILDKMTKTANMVLQYCAEADNTHVNRSTSWVWSKRTHSAVSKVVCVVLPLLRSSLRNSFHCCFPACINVYVRILHIETS